ncbi:Major facilitator superfamily domain general substrate transporter [Penicillium lagena]|uniref:Major facilitator superfamily domain general substrate transporter n=1 Tax=Penicillium lagena TaxID=94218 RepID=UPI002541ED76|nr:Major facilitator superfamily domain general substrate transporter [Penicillium lagena]KAJ5618766.1 Major facilitator superfamily domain general substrate transporter [Penicillium lagena]
METPDLISTCPSPSNSFEQCRCTPKDKEALVEEDKLPPQDRGIQAWLFLAASAMIEALVWGFAFSFGVFQSYYRTQDAFKDSKMVALIGTCATGVAYLSCPLTIVAMILLPGMTRWFSTIGLVIMSLSLATGSFATNVSHLVLSQGIAFGLGGCIAYSPSILFMPEWFVKRRGLAFGMVWAGSGLSGIVFPLLLEKLLSRFGFQTTLRILSVLVFVLAGPFLYFHKPRIPINASRRLTFRFLFNKVFVVYQAGNIFEALGFFLPALYLPIFAQAIGTSTFFSSFTVTAFNLASIFGSVSMGFLSDRFHVQNCILIATVGAAVSIFLLWGFSVNIQVLLLFSITYGLFAGSYSATWSGMINEIQRVDPNSDPTIIFSFIALGRGIGNVVSGPFSEALLEADSWKGHAWGAYGSGFGLLIQNKPGEDVVFGAVVVASVIFHAVFPSSSTSINPTHR